MYGNNDYRDYLMHHGIKGQQWGVQNGPPYPLDEAGKAKFSKRKQKKMLKKQDKQMKKERKAAMRNRRNLSDADIEKLSKRIKAEKELRNLVEDDVNHGRKVAGDILANSGKKVLGVVATGTALYGLNILIKSNVLSKDTESLKDALSKMAKNIDPKEAAGYIAPKPKQK